MTNEPDLLKPEADRLARTLSDLRFYGRNRRWGGMFRSFWNTLIRGHNDELCQECGAYYFSWHAPEPLWAELIGHGSGLLCPRCFDRKADRSGIWLMWTPMVHARRDPTGQRRWIETSNWWFDDTRDALMMGVPDPDIKAHYPEQSPWNTVREALATLPVAPFVPTADSYGAITGRVQTLTNRGGLRFALYDTLHDRAVSCYLAEGHESIMRDMWGRLASVEGLIRRDPITGRPLTIRDIRQIEPLPEHAPQALEAVRGISPSPQGLRAEDAIRRLRDA
jgi:hypothetical protein